MIQQPIRGLLVLAALSWATLFGAPAQADAGATGFIVAAPDRGFVGNERTRAAFAPFAADFPAELVFITDERTRSMLAEAAGRLTADGAETIRILPLVFNPAHPGLADLRQWAGEDLAGLPVAFGSTLGESYLGVEILAEAMRTIDEPGRVELVVLGYGGRDEASLAAMAEHLDWMTAHAAERIDFAATRSVVWPDTDGLDEAAAEAMVEPVEAELARAPESGRRVVVPMHMGFAFDSMMSLDRAVMDALPEGARYQAIEPAGDRLVTMWMKREARRALPLERDAVGVVFHAHGSDFHWNEGMRQAIAPLAERYRIEHAFSMADQGTIAAALERLEARGAQAAVVVRVFGQSGSFLGTIERMLGLDIENGSPPAYGARGMGGGRPMPRIHTALPVATAGGLESSPLFARALLDKALSHSDDPSRETLLVVAHGVGDDERNADWMADLEALRAHMLAAEGKRFRAIEIGTWREDWPEKREPAVERIRGIVASATRDGGDVIVVPARTTGQGPAGELLEGLEFELSEGFAPHPLFVEWVESQVEAGIDKLAARG
jgi:sirohydrochlorin ferrochelatase